MSGMSLRVFSILILLVPMIANAGVCQDLLLSLSHRLGVSSVFAPRSEWPQESTERWAHDDKHVFHVLPSQIDEFTNGRISYWALDGEEKVLVGGVQLYRVSKLVQSQQKLIARLRQASKLGDKKREMAVCIVVMSDGKRYESNLFTSNLPDRLLDKDFSLGLKTVIEKYQLDEKKIKSLHFVHTHPVDARDPYVDMAFLSYPDIHWQWVRAVEIEDRLPGVLVHIYSVADASSMDVMAHYSWDPKLEKLNR